MGWLAVTTFVGIGPGVGLHVSGWPHAADQPDFPVAGASLTVQQFLGLFRVTARVVEAAPAEAVIEMQDGTRWRMTPRAVHDSRIRVGMEDTHGRGGWVIRSAA